MGSNTSTQKHNFDANKNKPQHGLLPDGWERRMDPLGRACYVDFNTRSTTWSFPSLNQVVDHQAHKGDTTTTGPGSLPARWEERHTLEGRAYSVNHKTRTTTWVDPRRQTGWGASLQPQTVSQLGPLPSGWQTRLTSTECVYFVDHNTKMTTWDDP